MASEVKTRFIQALSSHYGPVHRANRSQSLYDIAGGQARIYVRYSRVHKGIKTFFGLRQEDLQTLEGRPSFLCFLWDGQDEPLMIPYSDYEDLFDSMTPASDGQFKTQVFLLAEGLDLYVARAGRFNVERYVGWQELDSLVGSLGLPSMPDLTHSRIQTLLGAIGVVKGYDVWIPYNDRLGLDWSLTPRFSCLNRLPYGSQILTNAITDIDVCWINPGSGELRALFEVEHSTPIFSGLLRLNDIHILEPSANITFGIVANDSRRSLFARQIRRPTFERSSLSEHCRFLEYSDVYGWYTRLRVGA